MVKPVLAGPLATPKAPNGEVRRIRPNVVAHHSTVFGSDGALSTFGRSAAPAAPNAKTATLTLPEPLVNKYLEAPEMCCFLKFLETLAEIFTFSLYQSRTWNGRFDEDEVKLAANYIALFSGPELRQQMRSHTLTEIAAGFGEHIKRQNPDLTDEEVEARAMTLAATVAASHLNTRLTDGVLRRLNWMAYSEALPELAPMLSARLNSRESGALSFWTDLQRLDQHPNVDRIQANEEFVIAFCRSDATQTHAPDREALFRLLDMPAFLQMSHAEQVDMLEFIAEQARVIAPNRAVADSRHALMEAVFSGKIKLKIAETGLDTFLLNAQGTELTVSKLHATEVFNAGAVILDTQFKELTSHGQQAVVRLVYRGLSPNEAIQISHLKEFRAGGDETRDDIVGLASSAQLFREDEKFNQRWQKLMNGELNFSFSSGDSSGAHFLNKEGSFVFNRRHPTEAARLFTADVHFSAEFAKLSSDEQHALASVTKQRATELTDRALQTLLRQPWFTAMNAFDRSRAILLQGHLASNPSHAAVVNPASGVLPYTLRFLPLPEGSWAVASDHDPSEVFVQAFDPALSRPLYKKWELRPQDRGDSSTAVGLIETALKETAIKPPYIEYNLSAASILALHRQLVFRTGSLSSEGSDELTGAIYALYYFTPASQRAELVQVLAQKDDLKLITDRIVQRPTDVPAEPSADANTAFEQIISFAMSRPTETKPNGQILLTDPGTQQLLGFAFRASIRLKPTEILGLETRLDALALTRHVDSVTIARVKAAVRRAYEFVASQTQRQS